MYDDEKPPSKKNARKPPGSGPKVKDPYAADDTSAMLLPVFGAIGAFIPLLYCLCKLWVSGLELELVLPSAPFTADPPENCHLTVKKLPKTDIFSKKNCQNFLLFFWKKWKLLANFLTVKWQFSGGSEVNQSWNTHRRWRLRVWNDTSRWMKFKLSNIMFLWCKWIKRENC